AMNARIGRGDTVSGRTLEDCHSEAVAKESVLLSHLSHGAFAALRMIYTKHVAGKRMKHSRATIIR
ncbi:MAG: hypothetical protein M3P51_00635, partial [Chloroflexota bacterium]|nr:hypothetical protein [Chloroflexota bacterium]